MYILHFDYMYIYMYNYVYISFYHYQANYSRKRCIESNACMFICTVRDNRCNCKANFGIGDKNLLRLTAEFDISKFDININSTLKYICINLGPVDVLRLNENSTY